MVMGDCGQVVIYEFHAAAIQERTVARYRNEHRPTAVIRYADDAALVQHVGGQCSRL